MTYVLIQKSEVSETSHLFQNAVEVEVCGEDGTVHAPRFVCPTCYLRRSDDDY